MQSGLANEVITVAGESTLVLMQQSRLIVK